MKKVFKEGDLVVMERGDLRKKKGLFEFKVRGPFVIKSVFDNGTYELKNLHGNELLGRVNGHRLRQYHGMIPVQGGSVKQVQPIRQS